MARNESRAKTYLVLALKRWVHSLTPADLHLDDTFKVEVRGEENSTVLLSIKDGGLAPRYFEVRVTEKM